MDNPKAYAARNRQHQLVTREDRLDRAANGATWDRLGWALLIVLTGVAWASVVWVVTH